MTEGIQGALTRLFSPNQVIELRILGDRTRFGYYNDFAKMASDAAMFDTCPDTRGIYITLNQVNPALLNRCINHLKVADRKDTLTSDGDIIRRRWLPIDIDPVRPSGISSSDEEHQASLRKAEQIALFLSGLGWPEPVSASSGNGAHLLYQIDLPVDPENSAIVSSCLKTLDQIFSDSTCTVDTSVHNLSRIWKLYGTISRKGDNSSERPYRRAKITSIPTDLSVVPLSALAHLSRMGEQKGPDTALSHPSSSPIRRPTDPIDLGGWLTENGLIHTEKPYADGRLFSFAQCPFSTAHTDGAYAIQFENGAIFAGCHHASCGGGSQRWPELKKQFTSSTKSRDFDRWKRKNNRDRAEGRMTAGTEWVAGESEGIAGTHTMLADNTPLSPGRSEAMQILREGRPITYLLDAFARGHEGDSIVAQCLIMSLASRSVKNSNGLHVLVTGESGKGKSHAFNTMLSLVPGRFRLSGGMSDKALFYMDDVSDGSVICMDDISLSDQMQEILKGVTTRFHEPFMYRTVDKDRKAVHRQIPAKCVWWVAKVEGSGDDQIWNRMLTVWIDDSEEQDLRVLKRELADAAMMPDGEEGCFETQVCQQLWELLEDVEVIIPYAERIRFTSSSNRRNSAMLLDLIRSITALFQFQRERVDSDGGKVVVATEEDFALAREIYEALSNESGGQMTKLTRAEAALVDAIRSTGRSLFTIGDMQTLVDRSYSTIYRMLHNQQRRGNQHTGLLEKCPPLTLYDRTETDDTTGTQKRTRVYVWDYDMDRIWSSGGGCWLSDPDEGSDQEGPDDGSGDVCTTVHQGCRTDCIEKEAHDELVSKNNCTCTSTLECMQQEAGSEQGGDASSSPGSCVCDPDTVAYSDPGPGSLDEEAPVSAPEADLYVCSEVKNPVTPLDECAHMPTRTGDENSGSPSPGPDTKGRIPVTDIDPERFVKVRGFSEGVCDCCGRRSPRYVERPGEKGKAHSSLRKVCERCYGKAVTRTVMSISALPGLISPDRMVREDRELGRCHVCNLKRISWWDADMAIGLCDTCYEREKQTWHRSQVVD